jgi:PAS domain S-box-containing protein
MDFSDQDFLFPVLSTKKLYISKPAFDPISQQPSFVIAVPILDARGEVRAVLTGKTNINDTNFLPYIFNSTLHERNEFFVISPRDNLIVAATNSSRILSTIKKRGVSPLLDKFIEGFEGSGMINGSDGILKLVSAKHVPISGWILIQTLPANLVLAPLAHIQMFLFLIAGFMTLVAVLFIHYMVRRVLAPLAEAGRAIHDITKSSISFPSSQIKPRDEVATLINNFSRLTEEKKRTAWALDASEEHFRQLVESAPDAIIVQVDARFAYVNLAAVLLFQSGDKAQLLNRKIVSCVHPDNQHVVLDLIKTSGDIDTDSLPQENTFLRKDGTFIDIETSCAPFVFENKRGSIFFARDITELNRAKAFIRDEEILYKLLFDNMLEGFAYCQIIFKNGSADDFIFLNVNPAFMQLTGLTNIIGKKGSSVLSGAVTSHQEFLQICSRVADGGKAERIDIYVDSLGNYYSVSIYSATKGYFMTIFNVITEKVKTEQLLKKQSEEVRALVENSPDMILRFDRNLECTFVNTAMETAYGSTRDTILGKRYDQIDLNKKVAAQWNTAIMSVVDNATEQIFEFFLASHSGDKHYQARLVPEFYTTGIVSNVLAVAHDVSAIEHSKVLLLENEQKIRGIAANTPGMVFQCVMRVMTGLIDFTFVSEGSVLLLGLTPEEILANPDTIRKQLSETDQRTLRNSLRQALATMSALNWDVRIISRQGQEKWINCRASPRVVANLDIIWEGVIVNITANKYSEQKLIESRQILRDLSTHMEGVREEERKRIAREIHDDLGQALTVLHMDLSFLRLSFGGQNVQLMEKIRSMKEDVDRTIRIMRHVTSTLRPVALDLGLIAGIEWLIQQFTRHTRVICQFNTELEEIKIDDGRATAIFRIIQESLTNVTRHAQATEVSVSISIKNNDHIHLKVHDNGKGFSLDASRKISSFGLIGIRERVLMLQGVVRINSSPGEGTNIEVCIPLNEQLNEVNLVTTIASDQVVITNNIKDSNDD